VEHLRLRRVIVVARGTAKARSRLFEMPPLTFRGRASLAPSSTPEGRWRHFFLSTMSDSSSEEVWKPVPGYDGVYEASSEGRVRSTDRQVRVGHGATRTAPGKILSQTEAGRGYMSVSIRMNGNKDAAYVHHLVAKAFIGKPPGEIGPQSGDWQINHKNGDITDNRPENLEWVKREANTVHAHQNGFYKKGSEAPSAKLTADLVRRAREIRRSTGRPFRDIAEEMPAGKNAVKQAVRGQTWEHIESPAPIPA